MGTVLGMADIVYPHEIPFQFCKGNIPGNKVETNRKGSHIVYIDLVSRGKEGPRHAKQGKEGGSRKVFSRCKRDRGWYV